MKRAVAGALLYALTACGGGNPPPAPVPSPPPPEPLPVLTVSGNRFVPGIEGVVLCCSEQGELSQWYGYAQNGWPLVSTDALDRMPGNYAHFRVGPFTRYGEHPNDPGEFEGYAFVDGKYDLDIFNHNFDQMVRRRVQYANSRGKYVEIVLLDDWPAKVGLWPYRAHLNHQGVEYPVELWRGGRNVFAGQTVPYFLEKWVRHQVSNTCNLGVFYTVDNEPTQVNTNPDFTRHMRAIVKDEQAVRGCPLTPVGSGNDMPDPGDFRVIHTYDVPAPEPWPVLVNETDNREGTTGLEQALRYKLGLSRGAYFMGWKGPMKPEEFEKLLGYFANPASIPPANHGCPDLSGIKVKTHHWQGNKAVLDATPFPEVSGEGGEATLRCNSVWMDGFVPKTLQDSRGPVWRVVSGNAENLTWNPMQNPYLGHLTVFPGTPVSVQACSQANQTCSNIWQYP